MQRCAELEEEEGVAAPARAERAGAPAYGAHVWHFVQGLDNSNEKLAWQVSGQQGGSRWWQGAC